jgi:DeoR/GlpR family transcriptional regulator of sugar metabolism
LGDLDLIQTFITDDGISDVQAKEFESRGIELMIAR